MNQLICGYRSDDLIKLAEALEAAGIGVEGFNRPSGARILERIEKIMRLAHTDVIEKLLLRAEQEDLKTRVQEMVERVQEIDRKLAGRA